MRVLRRYIVVAICIFITAKAYLLHSTCLSLAERYRWANKSNNWLTGWMKRASFSCTQNTNKRYDAPHKRFEFLYARNRFHRSGAYYVKAGSLRHSVTLSPKIVSHFWVPIVRFSPKLASGFVYHPIRRIRSHFGPSPAPPKVLSKAGPK